MTLTINASDTADSDDLPHSPAGRDSSVSAGATSPQPPINAVYGPGFILCDVEQAILPPSGNSHLARVNSDAVSAPDAKPTSSLTDADSNSNPVLKTAEDSFIYLNTGSETLILTLDDNIIPGLKAPAEDTRAAIIPEHGNLAHSLPGTYYYFPSNTLLHDLDINRIITDITHY